MSVLFGTGPVSDEAAFESASIDQQIQIVREHEEQARQFSRLMLGVFLADRNVDGVVQALEVLHLLEPSGVKLALEVQASGVVTSNLFLRQIHRRLKHGKRKGARRLWLPSEKPQLLQRLEALHGHWERRYGDANPLDLAQQKANERRQP